jgi:hypothetical protein
VWFKAGVTKLCYSTRSLWAKLAGTAARVADETNDGERGEKEFWCGSLIASRTREMRHLILNLRRVRSDKNTKYICTRARAQAGNATPLVSGHFDGACQKLVLKGADRRD